MGTAMSATVTFDTLEFVESLESSGFTKEQSRGIVGALKEARDARGQELPTKSDWHERALRLERRMDASAADLKFIQWLLALLIATLVLSALKTLPG